LIVRAGGGLLLVRRGFFIQRFDDVRPSRARIDLRDDPSCGDRSKARSSPITALFVGASPVL
jgi:hypothetical protein